MTKEKVYNPLDKRNLGKSVAEALLERDVIPLGDLKKFEGAGLYAIYYVGDFPCYERIAEHNRDGRFGWPIYVGQAIAAGARTGTPDLDAPPGPVLHKRLCEHRNSVKAAENLSLDDFHCRYLSVVEHFISLGEALLIATYMPVWNSIVYGFGNHAPGGPRGKSERPRWDTLHPGRKWAVGLKDRKETDAQIAAEVENYLRSAPVPGSIKFSED